MSDEIEKDVDQSMDEEESRAVDEANVATDSISMDQAEAAISEEEINDQTDEGAVNEDLRQRRGC